MPIFFSMEVRWSTSSGSTRPWARLFPYQKKVTSQLIIAKGRQHTGKGRLGSSTHASLNFYLLNPVHVSLNFYNLSSVHPSLNVGLPIGIVLQTWEYCMYWHGIGTFDMYCIIVLSLTLTWPTILYSPFIDVSFRPCQWKDYTKSHNGVIKHHIREG